MTRHSNKPTRLAVLAFGALISACVACVARVPALTVSNRATDAAAVLPRWFDYVQRDQLDSLRPLLAPDFLFISDGTRLEADSFVAMIKSLGITDPRVQLSNVVNHESGNTAYVVYDRVESFESRGTTRTVPETGTIVLTRRDRAWLIALWTTTSPR